MWLEPRSPSPAIWWANPATTWVERGWNLVLRPPAIWWGLTRQRRGGTWLANVVGTSFPALRRSGGLTRQRRGCNVVGERGWNLVLRPPAIWWADPAATWWNVVGERGWNLVLLPPAIGWAGTAET